jgi:hypothetical protein
MVTKGPLRKRTCPCIVEEQPCYLSALSCGDRSNRSMMGYENIVALSLVRHIPARKCDSGLCKVAAHSQVLSRTSISCSNSSQFAAQNMANDHLSFYRSDYKQDDSALVELATLFFVWPFVTLSVPRIRDSFTEADLTIHFRVGVNDRWRKPIRRHFILIRVL